MATKSRYGDFRNCARCKGEINIADHCQLFLIRLDNYWHECCFRCKHCHKPIADRKFTELDGHAWHKSCYKQQHQGQVSNIKPKNPLLSGISKEMGKKMKIVMNGVGKKSKRQSHHVEQNAVEETREAPNEENPRVENFVSSAGKVAQFDAVKETREAPNEENPRVENSVSSAGKVAQFDAVKETREAPNEENPRVENSVSSAGEPVNAAAQDLDAHGTNQAANQTNLSSTSTTKPQPNFDPNSLRPDLIPIYDEILAKHGDIIKNCTLRSKIFKSTYSNSLCSILKDLQTTQVRNFNEYRLSEMLELLADMEKAGFDVEWLNAHLVKIKKFLELNKAYKTLEITRKQQAKAVHSLKNSIDLKEEGLSKLRSQFWEAKDKYDSIYHEIIVIKSSLDQCPMITLVDGLF